MADLEYIKAQEPTFLQRAKKKGYVCPKCGNGTGDTGDGITRRPNSNSFKCFKCGFYGDVIDLIGEHFSITDPTERIKKACEVYGISPTERRKRQKAPKSADLPPVAEEKEDFSAFYAEAEAANAATGFAYLKGRGISEAVQQYFHVGYVADWRSPRAIETVLQKGGNPANLPTTPRCIIPRSRYNYLARDMREVIPEREKQYEKQNTGDVEFFNLEALEQSSVVFIVEGEIDAMSVAEAGGDAVALCSAARAGLFVHYLEAHAQQITGKRFVLMLDNDEAGKRGQETLKEGLSRLGLAYIEATPTEKDPNAMLMADREGFAALISSLQAEALNDSEESAEVTKALEHSYNAAEMLDYFRHIEDHAQGFEAKTGFRGLDDEARNLYGGLHEGLYVIGAISSLGKTTFCLQLAAQVSGLGQDVIFFSLEQSKEELIAKCISRHTYDLYRESKDDRGYFIARETAQIMNNRRYRFFSPVEKAAIAEGIEAFAPEAANLYIYEGRYNGARLTVSAMRDIVKAHIERTHRAPVIFVDYLQIIAPTDPRTSDKQNTDNAVFELKEISRDFKIPVIAISSFNRENYYAPVTMAAFKESGAIEYSADILMGLQYSDINKDFDDSETDAKKKKRFAEIQKAAEGKQSRKEPVHVELKCLKNRNGNKFTLQFLFVAAFNHYEEDFFDADKIPPASRKKAI